MQALPPEQGSQAPHMMLRHSLGGGGQARWSDTGKPLRAAQKLKPPDLLGDIYCPATRSSRLHQGASRKQDQHLRARHCWKRRYAGGQGDHDHPYRLQRQRRPEQAWPVLGDKTPTLAVNPGIKTGKYAKRNW